MENLGSRKHSAIIYCCLVFVVSWSLWIAAGGSSDAPLNFSVLFLDFHFSQETVLVILGNLAPGVIAIVMGLLKKEKPFRNFLRTPRAPSFLYAFAIFAPLAIRLAMFMVQENLSLSAFARLRLRRFVAWFLVNILLAPLWEEMGWRGYLLPTLSKQLGLGRAALLVGFIWASWHLVLYHFVFRTSLYSYISAFVGIVPMAVILAVLYFASGNSLLLPVLFHASWNASNNWVSGVEPSYGLGPAILQAVAVWILAGIAWLWYRELHDNSASEQQTQRE
jgi:membrane protease YdiL (CAAX protease family)